MDKQQHRAYQCLTESLAERGVEVSFVEEQLRNQRVETPSWGYANAGTRFKVFTQDGVPRDPFEKFQDAAQVHRHTGICPSVAIHIPWDRVDDFTALKHYAESLGMRIGAVNPNIFQEQEYKLGSITNPDSAVRRRATEHLLECIAVAEHVGSTDLSLWFADGTNYPGQDSFIERRHRMIACLTEVYGVMPANMRMLVEYKFYEPAFYHTDLFDWGTSLLTCQKLGERAQVLVDLGHHPQGTNVEHIVSILLDENRLGGFHFNNRKYGDDDLMVGSVNPFELFLIYIELAHAERQRKDRPGDSSQIAYMIDQSHNIEPRIEAMIQSVMTLQEAYAKALLVDWTVLERAQRAGDVLAAHRVVTDAYATDVRPLCANVREDLGGSADPIAAFRTSGYLEESTRARRGGVQAGWT